ncbi:MAG: hypothetical protein NDJ18_04575 [candidate division Zixibacteria bacterium]|nr:hypothetical protein [candidate division Zixibacteria bacterium]
MNSTLANIKAKRTWLVHDLVVWGTGNTAALDLLLAETPTLSGELYFNTAFLGDSAQSVEFGQLTDHRGHQLPSTISQPHIIIRPRSNTLACLIGHETDRGFRIARDSASIGPAVVDLLIFEMGE